MAAGGVAPRRWARAGDTAVPERAAAVEPSGPVRHVISLGCRCSQAAIFKELGTRRYACPFDWIFSSASIVVHCLRDDFRSFLDRGQLYLNASVVDAIGLKPGSAPRERKLIGHHVYSGMMEGVGRGTIFNHRNPLHSESDYEYVCRTVDRFRLVMSLDERKLFVVMNLNTQLWIEKDLAELFEELCRRTRNFTLVAVNCCTNLGDQALRMEVEMQSCETRPEGQLLVYRLPCVGANSGSYFRDSFDAGRAREILVLPYNFALAGDPLDVGSVSRPTAMLQLDQDSETIAADNNASAGDFGSDRATAHTAEPSDEGAPVIRRWTRRAQKV